MFFIKYQNPIDPVSALIQQSDFYIYAALSLAISIISLLNFIINIMDIEKVDLATDDNPQNAKTNPTKSYDLDDTRETTNMLTI